MRQVLGTDPGAATLSPVPYTAKYYKNTLTVYSYSKTLSIPGDRIGYVAGREASAIGVNWMFNPVADVYKNWRNTIVNTRSFGSDPDRVIACVRAYIRGIRDAAPHMACTCKHFPGDGWDELDPHISPAHNEAGADEWMESYGKV